MISGPLSISFGGNPLTRKSSVVEFVAVVTEANLTVAVFGWRVNRNDPCSITGASDRNAARLKEVGSKIINHIFALRAHMPTPNCPCSRATSVSIHAIVSPFDTSAE